MQTYGFPGRRHRFVSLLLGSAATHLVTQPDRPAFVRFHLGQVQRNVLVEPVEEPDPLTDQDRQDLVANFVSQPEAKTFTGNETTPNEPNAVEGRPQPLIHE